MAEMKLVFLDERSETTGKTKKLITRVVERLAGAVPEGGPADFAAIQIVLPTAEAGRILREELALKCDDRRGVMNLSITLPEHLLQSGTCAPDAAVLSAWRNALRRADNRDFPTLLRNEVLDKYQNSAETLLGWAESFQRCRRELALEGLDLAGAVEKLNELCKRDGSETAQELYDRFDEFRRLEELYLAELKKLTPLPDPAAALKTAADASSALPGAEKIVLIDCLDLKNGPARWLERAAEAGVEVEFWIDAPETYRDRFDRFGRPAPELAQELRVELDLEKHLRKLPRPERQAQKLLELLTGCGSLPSAVAVPDPEVAEALELGADLAAGDAPDRHGVPRFFVPREHRLDRMPWTRLFLDLAALAADGSVTAAARLWEEPFFADYAEKTLGIADLPGALKLLDRLREENFAADTGFLLELARRERIRRYDGPACQNLEALCLSVTEMRRKLASGDLAAAAFELVGEIGGAKDLDHLELRRHENEIAALAKLVYEVSRLDGLENADALPLLRKLAAGTAVKLREKPWEEAVDVVGFLEIGYSRDDTVLMAGFNEEVLSGGAAVDPLLPEKLRETLGMTTRARRFAADALRFAALAASRELYILYGGKSRSGETLRPARLLLLCGKDELPHRVSALFGEALVEEPLEKPAPARKFEVPAYDLDGFSMSITGFKSYLACPFTFALQQILRAESHDPGAVEMDDLRYGTFFHYVLETLMKNYLGKSADEVRRIGPEELADAAMRALKRCENEYFGGTERLPGLAKLQCGIIAEALMYVAAVQSAGFADSWRPVALERKIDVDWGELYGKIFPGEENQPWRNGIRLKGKIDRIDLREGEDGSQELRVLDYKTSAKAEPPRDTHTTTRVPDGEADFRRLPDISETKTRCWKDLQLPLYVLSTRHVLIGEMNLDGARIATVRAGYFALPPEMTDIGIGMFDELERGDVLESAARCADEILRRIFVEKLFWPPKEKHYKLFDECELDIRDFAAREREVR